MALCACFILRSISSTVGVHGGQASVELDDLGRDKHRRQVERFELRQWGEVSEVRLRVALGCFDKIGRREGAQSCQECFQ